MPVNRTIVLDETRADPTLRQHQRIMPSPKSRKTLREGGYTWVLSSNVSAVAVRGDDLFIRFHNGSLYQYPRQGDRFNDMIESSSKGRWVWNNLRRPNVTYRKVGTLPLPEDTIEPDEEVMMPRVATQDPKIVETLATAGLTIKVMSERPSIPLLSD